MSINLIKIIMNLYKKIFKIKKVQMQFLLKRKDLKLQNFQKHLI
jgi:hypothetical protein